MCERLSNGIEPQYFIYGLKYQLSFKNNNSELPLEVKPHWKDPYRLYKASFNKSSTNYIPVMISKKHLYPSSSVSERIVVPMRWGLIPDYHNGSINDFKPIVINTELSHLSQNIYHNCIKKSRRCIIIAEGYYEWTNYKPFKIPYFFYFPENASIFSNWTTKNNKRFIRSGKWHGPKMLMIAGLFDICKKTDEGTIFSCTLIAISAHHKLQFISNKMPAILNSEESIKKWLDFEKVSNKEAFKLIKSHNLKYHKVNYYVTNALNDGCKCIQPCINEDKKKMLCNRVLHKKLIAKANNKDSNCSNLSYKTAPESVSGAARILSSKNVNHYKISSTNSADDKIFKFENICKKVNEIIEESNSKKITFSVDNRLQQASSKQKHNDKRKNSDKKSNFSSKYKSNDKEYTLRSTPVLSTKEITLNKNNLGESVIDINNELHKKKKYSKCNLS